jgi:hypothetical protein
VVQQPARGNRNAIRRTTRTTGTATQAFAGEKPHPFGIESLLFHLAGIPTYLVLAELAVRQVLSGRLAQVLTSSHGIPVTSARKAITVG